MFASFNCRTSQDDAIYFLCLQGSNRLRHVTDEFQRELEDTVKIMEASAPVSRSELAWPGLLRRLDRLNPGYAQ